MDIYSNKNAIKLVFFLFALFIGVATLLYTESFLKELRKEEARKAQLFVEAYDIAQNSTDDVNLSFVLKIIEGNSTIPIIVVNENGEISNHRNLDPEKSKNPAYLKKQLDLMAESNEPIPFEFDQGRVVTLYYKESTLLSQLRIYPVVLLLVIGIFIIIAYLLFSSSRRSEQNRVWTGMAKETAHQIGTPLSSLIGWIEILRSQNADEMALTEMEKDVKRLENITDRFSKIGSMPQMFDKEIYPLVEQSFNYLKPRVSRKTEMTLISEIDPGLVLSVNPQLLSWVIENLVRNAIDALDGKGKIEVHISDVGKQIKIDVSDTGKGIPLNKFKAVFRPGFTTKSRGWGLGLSLAKRIIVEYHKGIITVANSELGKGTTFRILLPKKEA